MLARLSKSKTYIVFRRQVVIVGLDPDAMEEEVSEALDKKYDTQTISVNSIRYNRLSTEKYLH